MIFSRNKGGGASGKHSARRRDRDEFGPPYDDEDAAVTPPATGPFDASEVADDVERLDLGSLKIAVPPGVELRVQADAEGQVQQVVLAAGDSALQLGVFAAPRTEGIWEEVREDIRKQLFGDGVAAEEGEGEYGVELKARVRTPEGMVDIRFVGVDGPRWLVRAVYQGPAATDAEAAKVFDTALHGLVVERGSEAMPVRDPLPLRLPREVTEHAQGESATDAEAPAPPRRPRTRPTPKPRRG